MLLGSSSWLNCTKCSYSEDFGPKSACPLSSKYCRVVKKLVFPTPGTPKIRKKTSYVSDSITVRKSTCSTYCSINSSTSDFKTFKGLVSYGLSLSPVLFHKFLGSCTKYYLVCLVQVVDNSFVFEIDLPQQCV